MDESRKPNEEPDLNNLFTYFNEIIAPWKEMERQLSDLQPGVGDGFAEGEWSNSLKHLFLWQTIQAAGRFRVLSKNRNN
jgi:hypothetical protein